MQPDVHQDDHAHPQGEAPPLPLDPEDVIRAGGLPPMPSQPPPLSEAVHLGAEYWFAREFVGGLVSVAEAMKIPVQDFLADKVFLLSQRLALAESEVQILRHQMMEAAQENAELHHKLDDCNCQDEEEGKGERLSTEAVDASTEGLQASPAGLSLSPSPDSTNNGDND